MKLSNKLLLAVFGGALSTTAVAQTCFSELTETSSTAKFNIGATGLVEDKTTGLMWSRCTYGQTWDQNNNTCSGSPVSITWQDALQLSATMTEGGFSDWRLPNVKELATIVEKACVDPAVNATVFPASLPENYWTSTTAMDDTTTAWAVAMYNGKNNAKDKLQDLHVRFVRFSQ